jgi:hypothetical protein
LHRMKNRASNPAPDIDLGGTDSCPIGVIGILQ